MDLQAILDLRQELECQLQTLITGFELETKVHIEHVELERARPVMGHDERFLPLTNITCETKIL